MSLRLSDHSRCVKAEFSSSQAARVMEDEDVDMVVKKGGQSVVPGPPKGLAGSERSGDDAGGTNDTADSPEG